MILYVFKWVHMCLCVAFEGEREEKKRWKAKHGNKAVHETDLLCVNINQTG